MHGTEYREPPSPARTGVGNMNPTKKIFCLMGILSLCIDMALAVPDGGIGDDDYVTLDSVFQIGEVAVVANHRGDIVPAQTLSGERLKSLNSFAVADAIRYFSGVQIKDYGGVGGMKTVDIRSMGTNHMGVFYDGIQLGNAQNGQIDLGKFSLDNIEEISLYNGQKSSIFQSAKDFGSSGTIYLRSRRPTFDDGKQTNLRMTMRTGSFGLVNPSVLWEQRLSDNVSMSVNAEYTYATGRYKFRYRKVLNDGTVAWDTTATRQNGDIHALRLEGGLNGRITDGYWNARLYYYDSEKGIPGAIVNNVWKRAQRQWDRNFFAQGTYQRSFGKYDLQVNGKYAHDFMHYLNPDTTQMYINNRFWQNELYMSAANHYTITPEWHAALSADWQYNWLDATLTDFVNPRRTTILVAAATTYETRHLKLLGSLLQTIASSSPRNGSAEHRLTPALFITYKPLGGIHHDELSIRAFYKKIFRMPTFNDLYYTDIGNVSLRPEYTTQYDLGVQYTHAFAGGIISAIDGKADIYYNLVTDKIISVPKGNSQYRWMMMNIGEARIRGIDVNINSEWQFAPELAMTLSAAYTYQKAQDYTDPNDNDSYGGTYKGQIAYVPWHNGSLTAHITYRDWGLNYAFSYVGKRYHNSANIPANYEKPWYTHDLGITRTLTAANHSRLTLALEINNILNHQYNVVLNYPMPGRNFKIKVSWDY